MKYALTIWLFALAVAAAAADEVVTAKGTKTGDIEAIRASGVKLSGAPAVPLAKIKTVRLAAPPVVAKDSGIVLRNGTRFAGVLRRFDDKQIVFRTTTLGLLTLPLKQVAYVYYDNRSAPTTSKSKGFTVRLKNRKLVTGTIFARSPTRLVLKTDDGLEKIVTTDIAQIIFGRAATDAAITLRNGDVINETVKWHGDNFTFKLAGTSHKVSLAAVSTIQFSRK